MVLPEAVSSNLAFAKVKLVLDKPAKSPPAVSVKPAFTKVIRLFAPLLPEVKAVSAALKVKRDTGVMPSDANLVKFTPLETIVSKSLADRIGSVGSNAYVTVIGVLNDPPSVNTTVSA